MSTATAAPSAPRFWSDEPANEPGRRRIRARIGGLHCSLCTGTIACAAGKTADPSASPNDSAHGMSGFVKRPPSLADDTSATHGSTRVPQSKDAEPQGILPFLNSNLIERHRPAHADGSCRPAEAQPILPMRWITAAPPWTENAKATCSPGWMPRNCRGVAWNVIVMAGQPRAATR